MSLYANISDTPFDQKPTRPPEKGVLNNHRQTDRHGYSMTESAPWGRFRENTKNTKYINTNYRSSDIHLQGYRNTSETTAHYIIQKSPIIQQH